MKHVNYDINQINLSVTVNNQTSVLFQLLTILIQSERIKTSQKCRKTKIVLTLEYINKVYKGASPPIENTVEVSELPAF